LLKQIFIWFIIESLSWHFFQAYLCD